MGRKSTTIQEYQALAAKNDLEFIESIAPRNIHTSSRWKCKTCGRMMDKNYANVRANMYSCPCKHATLTQKDYENLANSLKIRWIGSKLPLNTKKLTDWHGILPFKASYNALGYGNIPKRLFQYLPEIDDGS